MFKGKTYFSFTIYYGNSQGCMCGSKDTFPDVIAESITQATYYAADYPSVRVEIVECCDKCRASGLLAKRGDGLRYGYAPCPDCKGAMGGQGKILAFPFNPHENVKVIDRRELAHA